MNCPHCSAVNADDSQFCEQCGKVIAVAASGPRVVHGGKVAATGVGRDLQATALAATAKKAAGALLAVAILQAIAGTVMVYAAKKAAVAGTDLTVLYVVVYGVAAVFFGLYLWARRNPLPAAISGLVVFLTLHGLEAVSDPESIAKGILVKIIIIVVLARAISAGMKHRALKREAPAG